MPRKKRTVTPMHQRARELRQRQTPAEAMLWQRLRRRQLKGYYFRRQQPIGGFIADFYCADAQLVIELDGGIHVLQADYDAARSKWLKTHGYQVIRFSNPQILQELPAVLEAILWACEADKSPSP
jgi:very-short-patch-repair endonuclease